MFFLVPRIFAGLVQKTTEGGNTELPTPKVFSISSMMYRCEFRRTPPPKKKHCLAQGIFVVKKTFYE